MSLEAFERGDVVCDRGAFLHAGKYETPPGCESAGGGGYRIASLVEDFPDLGWVLVGKLVDDITE